MEAAIQGLGFIGFIGFRVYRVQGLGEIVAMRDGVDHIRVLLLYC